MGRGWLLLLCAWLLVWIPMNFAVELASSLPTLGFRGPFAILELVLHAAAAALAAAAGWALWTGSEGGIRLAIPAVAASTAVGIQSIFWTMLPNQTRPGAGLALAAVYAAAGVGWIVYLRRRARPSR